MPSVAEDWDRIHRWLGKHAPKILGNLNPGATGEEIATAERVFGTAMPAEWRALYGIHNGMNSDGNFGSLFHGMTFLPLMRVIAECSQNADSKKEVGSEYTPEVMRNADPGINRPDLHNPGWIPFAHDGGDTLIRVDMNPSADGNRGQVIFTDHSYCVGILLAPSIGKFLTDFANDLENGYYFLNPQAREDGNEFLDCVAEIDLANWWKSSRWKHLEK
jgi:cell wall assembly regulator SMI1